MNNEIVKSYKDAFFEKGYNKITLKGIFRGES